MSAQFFISLNRWAMFRILGLLASLLLYMETTQAMLQRSTPLPDSTFETVGVYLWPSWARETTGDYEFWKASGYNTIFFLVTGISFVPPAVRDANLVAYRKRIEDAQEAGFKVGIVLLSNISKTGHSYDPRDEQQMTGRLADIKLVIQSLSIANSITFFAGDPGGTPSKLGSDGVKYFWEMALKVQAMVGQYAPHSLFNINLWAITHWDDINISPFSVDFWRKEVEYSKVLLANTDFKETGIEFPLHNYYRSLALHEYTKAGLEPEKYPTKQDIADLYARGVKQQWAWPYFLIDEVDDGYTGYLISKVHPTQSETRYIRDIVAVSRKLRLNGMIVNAAIDSLGFQTEVLNVYALGRMCSDPLLTPEQVIDDFAGLIANADTRRVLADVLMFVENNSTWEASIPPSFRMPSFNSKYKQANAALDALAYVEANTAFQFPLPIAPKEYLERLRTRLLDIAGSEL